MKILSRPKTPIGFIVIISVVLAALFALFYISRAGAADETATRDGRLVTFHDRGAQRVIVTKSDTVQAAAREAGIRFDKNDIVEPGLDEKLVATDYTVNIYRARPVIVTDGMVRQKIMTAGQTPEKIASDAGITLHDEDKTSVQPVRDVVEEGAGVELLIARATSFTLVLYGEKTTVYTQKKTVGEMLAEKKITIAGDDTVSVKKSDPLTEGMIVEIWRNGKQTITEEQDIAFETEKIQDADREIGFKEVKTPGVKGKKSVSYEVEMKNGKEVARKEIQSVVTTQPKKQIEIVGAKMTNTFSGSFAEALARLRSCEGSYTSNTGNGYYGAYQFDKQTWGGYGGFAVASDAPAAVQDQKAWETYQRRGWQPWPSCKNSQGLQDIYR